MENHTPKTKRIIVSYSDPYATDSSSDESDHQTQKKPKRIVHEIIIQRKQKIEEFHKEKKYVGVRAKKGRYSATIKDPSTKKRVWLGSFTSAEEASKAYNSKKIEFEGKRSAKQGFDWVSLPQDFPCSVLEIDGLKSAVGENKGLGNQDLRFGFLNGIQVVDDNGFFVGEFSKIDDDLSIRTSEDGCILSLD